MKRNLMKAIIPVLVLITLITGGCAGDFNFNFGFNGIEKKGEESTVLNVQDASRLDVRNETGEITVSRTRGDKLNIRFEKEVRGQVEEEMRKVLDEIKISAGYQNGTLEVKAVTKDGTTDFWKWKHQNHPMLSVSIDIYVELPENLPEYDVRLVTGNIEVNGLEGAFFVENVTGKINVTDVVMKGTNKISLVTGDIRVSPDVADADSLSVRNVTGNVTVTLDENLDAVISAKLTTGNIEGSLIGQSSNVLGGARIEKTYGDGKTDITVENVTGQIIIDKK